MQAKMKLHKVKSALQHKAYANHGFKVFMDF